MPELPEVETTRRGIAPRVEGHRVTAVVVRQPRLRQPIPPELAERLPGQRIRSVARRAKYLLLECDRGTLILHLGMSGSLWHLPAETPPGKHDHLDLMLDDGHCLRLRDPRRFGLALWTEAPPETHPLLAPLGIEPLDPAFDGPHLHRLLSGSRVAVKQALMDGRKVVGIGNIYASESLFRAGIHPATPAGRLSHPRCARLAAAIREVLTQAVAAGGTTLRDFSHGDGTPGYFQLQCAVYGREGEPCPSCGTPIRHLTQGQRSTWFCPRCQPR